MQPLSQATREIMWNVSHVPLFYAVFVVALTVFGFGVYRRIRCWKAGSIYSAWMVSTCCWQVILTWPTGSWTS